MKKNKKNQLLFLLPASCFVILAFLFFAFPGLAQVSTDYDIALGNASPIDLAVSIINWGLGILALIAVVIILYGGFVWMTSNGDDEKVEKAKKILRNGIIGLVIILAAWGIATYLVGKLYEMTNPPNTSGTPTSYTYSNGNPFMIDHSNPADNESDVSLCHLVAVTFTLPVQEASITSDTFKVTEKESGTQLSGSYAFSESGYVAVWYPEYDYDPLTTYRVELTTAVVGLDEVTIDTYNLDAGDPKRVFEFTTGTTTDEIPPKVDIVSVTPYPEDEEEEVCRNTPIQTSFSESLDPASVRDTNIWLYNYIDDTTVPADGDDELTDVRFTSIGGQADDTFITSPSETLDAYTSYGLSLYSGEYDPTEDSVRMNYEGAIKDTCGNPLSGDFDDEMEGSPTDDFIETTSAGGEDWDYQWTFTTGDVVYCVPNIESISYSAPAYYSEDKIVYNHEKDDVGAGDEDSDIITVTGQYLYPFYDVDFYNNISAAGMNCFTSDHVSNSSCYVSNSGSSEISVRLPVGSQTNGRISVENEYGSDKSAEALNIDSPYVRNLSPQTGPPGQFITLKGNNFIDYDPDVTGSEKGKVYFEGVEVETPCADGWDDDQIIVKIPDNFADLFAVDDFLEVQVVTVGPDGEWDEGQWDNGDGSVDCSDLDNPNCYDDKYSNTRGFTLNDEDPGPGLCALDPDCSDSGVDDVSVIGQNFGSNEGDVYFDNGTSSYTADIQGWNETYVPGDLTAYADYKMVLTSETPINVQDTYEVFAEDDNNNYSNGLDFDLPCQEPPELFEYFDCDLENTFYLPNPRPYEDEACKNGTIMLAFTDDMDDDGSASLASITSLMDIYGCGSGDNAYSTANCSDASISGSWDPSEEFLNAGYFGGNPLDGDLPDDNYQLFTFSPATDLSPNTWYRVYVQQEAANEQGVTMTEAVDYYFKVRSGDEDCSVDIVDLRPAYIREGSFDLTANCPENYTDDDGYAQTYRARPYNSDCFALDDDFTWRWYANNYEADEIVGFNSDPADTLVEEEETENGYNSVCMQGEGEGNFGVAYVYAGPADDSGYPAFSVDEITYEDGWTYDLSMFEVDLGYCTSDDDCRDDVCTESTCDLTTSHCSPEINSYSPDTEDDDLGPGGCITLRGCNFGGSRTDDGTCTCTTTNAQGEDVTCEVAEDRSTCLVASNLSCTLVDDAGNSLTCDSSIVGYTYNEPEAEGSIAFSGTGAEYLNENLCGSDTWRNTQIVAELPETISPGTDYSVTATTYYDLSDTYGSVSECQDDAVDADYDNETDCESADLDWEEPLIVQSFTTPCLCKADPYYAQEGQAVTLYGKYFDTTTLPGTRVAEFYNNKTSEGTFTALDSTTYGDYAWTVDTNVADGATSSEDGVLITDGSLPSNAIEFNVTCNFNSDCSTRCCSDNLCEEAEVCNACEGLGDCQYGNCLSECTNGMCEPYIISVNPGKGTVGQPVTLRGCHFGSYYNPVSYPSTYSAALFNSVEADLACAEDDSWNNEEIKVIAPDGTFVGDETEAEVIARQVYRNESGDLTSQESTSSGAGYCTDVTCETAELCELDAASGGCESEWHYTNFNKDESCDDVKIPVLCTMDPANGVYGDLITMEGDNFYNADSTPYCLCEGKRSSDDCQISEGGTDCSISYSYDCYANPDDSTTKCSTTLSANEGANYYVEEGCSEAYYTSQAECEAYGDCDDGSTHVAETDCSGIWTAYTWGTVNQCRCVNPDAMDEYCYIISGIEYCTYTDDYTCYVGDLTETPDDLEECSENSRGYTELNGRVEFAIEESAEWDYYPDAGYDPSPYSTYLTAIVPDGTETGSVYVQAVKANGTVCESNGMNFDVTCDSCSDCADDLMCDLTYGDGAYGVCTSSTTGFCEEQPDSCCGNTGCRSTVVEESCTIDADGNDTADTCSVSCYGADCAEANVDGECICESDTSDKYCTMSVGESSCDITDGGACYERPLLEEDGGNFAHGDTDICPNAEITVAFDSIMTTYEAVTNEEEVDYTEHIKLFKEDVYVTTITDQNGFINISNTEIAAEIERLSDNSIWIKQSELLETETLYTVVIYSNPDENEGLIDDVNNMALGCEDDQEGDVCSVDAVAWKINFTTGDQEGGCPPDYIDLAATSSDFIDANYTFIEKEEEQNFNTTVYYNGDDEIEGTDDDQAITGIDGVFNWDYEWSPIYASMEDLTNSACPYVGILSEGNTGSCLCNLGECEYTQEEGSCTVAEDGISCTVDDTSETCYMVAQCDDTDGCECTVTDSTSEVCTIPDQGYECTTATLGDCYLEPACDQTAGCNCTLDEESCIIEYGSTTCDLSERGITVPYAAADQITCDSSNTYYDDSSDENDYCTIAYDIDLETQASTCDTPDGDTCDLGEECTPDVSSYSEDDFLENKRTQKVSADSQEGESWVTATIIGDGSTNHNWEGEKTDSRFVRVLFCDSAEYLSSYEDSDYNFSLAYCRGSSADELLPDFFDGVTEKNPDSDDQFLKEYLFTNDENEDLIGVIVYPNDLDSDVSTVDDAVKADIWADLRLENFGSASKATIDDYEAVENNFNTLVASTNLSGGVLYPNIYMIAINKAAEAESTQALELIKEHWFFNTNSEFAPLADQGCQEEKDKVVRDTQRITDLGTTAYMLAQYYHLDGNSNDVDDYPDIAEGSYIRHITTSAWPSWDSTLGNALGQSMYTDPTNEFEDAATNCPFNEDPNGDGDLSDGIYYDTEGTCWDPINKDYFCPTDSYIYQYQYDGTTGYDIYANLESTSYWNNYTGDPCSGNEYTDAAGSEYDGCECFDYNINYATLDFYYGTCDTASNTCNTLDSGFLAGSYCTEDLDCQIVNQ